MRPTAKQLMSRWIDFWKWITGITYLNDMLDAQCDLAEKWRGHWKAKRDELQASRDEVLRLKQEIKNLNDRVAAEHAIAMEWNRKYADVKVRLAGIASIINDGFYGNKVGANAPVPVTPLPAPPGQDSVAAIFTEALKDVPDTGTVEDYFNLVGGLCKSMFSKQDEVLFDRTGAIEHLVRNGMERNELLPKTDEQLRCLIVELN